MNMEKDYKEQIQNNNIFYENTEGLNIGKQNQNILIPSDDDLGTNKFKLKLTNTEAEARKDGFLRSNSGSTMVDTSEYTQHDLNTILGKSESSGISNVTGSTGKPNTTALYAEDYVNQDEIYVTSGQLWRDTLGSTAYADLKHKCGLRTSDSYTEYYNKTGYVPSGYEVEAKLLLAEEKRMKYYADYEEGKISKSDFLYQAYGKDLMKESGYDLSSTLYWYNKAKNNDYSNPLDSDTFLSELISNAEQLWQKETWYKSVATRDIGSTLAGLATGTELSEESFQIAFKTEVEALKPYFNNDVKKIMTYYQAGYLGSAFSPLIDIDGDNKFDYYYHTDGKLYAVDGSSGQGSSTCELVYNSDGSVHSVQIHEMLDGWLDSLWDGFEGFFIGFADMFAIIPGLINTDYMANYEAWKKRTIADEDRVVFDSMDKWNANDWGNAVAEGVGTIAGMVLMLVLTWGIGNALQGGTEAAKAGAKYGVEQAAKVTSKETATAVMNSIKDKAVELGSSKARKVFMDNALKGLTKELVKNQAMEAAIKEALKESAKEIGASIVRGTISNAARNVSSVLIGKSGFTSTISQAKGGSLINSTLTRIAQNSASTNLKKFAANAWVRGIATATELAARDYITVTTQLKAKNKALQYLEYASNGEVKALSDGEIFARASIVAGTDLLISSLFRAQGSQGFTSRVIKNSDTIINNLTNETKETLQNYIKHMKTYCKIDAAFDIFENITTTAVQAAASNPYAKTAGDFWNTAWQSVTSPTFIASNIYATWNNLASWGGKNGEPISTSIYDDRMGALVKQININAGNLASDLETFNSILLSQSNSTNVMKIREVLDRVRDKTLQTLNNPEKTKADNLLEASRNLDTLFTEDLVTEQKDAILKAFNLSESEYNEINTLVKNYNKDKSDEDKIGFVTGKVFYSANKDNDEAVAYAYNKVLEAITDRKADLKEQEQKAGHTFLTGGGILLPKSRLTSLTYTLKLFHDIDKSLDAENFRLAYQDIIDSFVCKRFEMLTDVNSDENEELRNKELAELKDYLNSDWFKFQSLSTATAGQNVTYTLEPEYDKDKKTILRRKLKGTVTEDNVILQLLTNYEENKEIINKLHRMNLLDLVYNDDGSITINFANMAPWYALEVDNAKLNEIRQAKGTDDNARVFFEILDSTAYIFENEYLEREAILDYDEPLIVKVNIATGKTNGSGAPEYKTVYLMPSKISSNTDGTGTSYGDVANRLMALQGILYSTYGLFKQAKEGVVDSQTAIKYLAQLGALLQEGCAMDPYFDFLKLFNSDKEEDREKAKAYLPNAMISILSRCRFNKENGKEPSTLLTRKQLMAFVNAGVFGDKDANGGYALLNQILEQTATKNGVAGNAEINKVAQELLDYITATDKIKESLKVIKDFQDNYTKTLDAKDKEKLMDCMKFLKENKNLKDSLEADGMLPDEINDLLKSKDAETFSLGLQKRDSHLATLSQNLLRLSKRDGQNKKEIESFLRMLLDEDAYTQLVIKDNPLSMSREFLIRYLKTGGTEFTIKVANALKALSLPEFKDFLKNPQKFINDFNMRNISRTYELSINDFGPLFVNANSGRKVLDYNYLFGLSLYTKFNELTSKEFLNTLDETYATLEDIYTDIVDNPNSNIFNYVKRLYKIATGEDLKAEDLIVANSTPKGFKRSFPTLMIKDGTGTNKSLADIIYSSDKAATVIVDSIVEDSIQNTVALVQDAIDYYWKDTTITPKQNVVEIDMTTFLPANLRIALTDFMNNKLLATKMGVKAKIDSKELVKEFTNLLTGKGSNATYTQYQAYKTLLNQCMSSGNYILRFNLNNQTSINRLKAFLTSCGYDNFELNSTQSGISNIPGLYYKTIETHNLETDLLASKFYMAARKYNDKPGTLKKFMSGNKAQKDYIKVLFNLFSGVTRFNDKTKVKLLDVDGDAIPYYSLIYNKLDKNLAYTFKNIFGNMEQDRSEKGTLSGGTQLLQYIYKYRGLGIDTSDGNVALDETSLNSYIITSLAKATEEYLGSINPKTNKASTKDFTGKQAQTIQITIPKKYQDKFKAMYDGTTPSFFKLAGNPIGDTFILEPSNITAEEYLKQVNVKGFDIRQVLPVVWTNDKSIKNAEFKSYEYISNETLFSILANLKLPNLKTIDDFINFKPIKAEDIYSFDSQVYKDFCNNNNDKTVGELLKAIPENTNNYFLKSLRFELEMSKAYSEFAEEQLGLNVDLLTLANPKIFKILGSMLNDSTDLEESSRFGKLLNKDYIANEDDLQKLADALNSELHKAENVFVNKATSLDNVDDVYGFSSLDVDKFNTSNNLETITVETLGKLIDILKGCEENYLIRLSDDIDFMVPNDLLSAITGFCETTKGKLSISMEYFMNASQSQRKAFLDFIVELKTNPTDYNLTDEDISALDDLLTSINEKILLINNIKPDANIPVKPSEIVFEFETPNSPRQGVDVKKGFLSSNMGSLNKNQLQEINSLLMASYTNRVKANPFIKLSSINTNDDVIESPFKHGLSKLLNVTVCRTSDKPGSVFTYNMDTDEAIANAAVSVLAFAQNTKLLLEDMGVQELNDIPFDVLLDLGLQANLLTTGADYQAEFASSLILKYNSETKEYTIVPLVTSSSDSDRGLFRYFLGLETDNYKVKNITLKNIQEETKNNPKIHYILLSSEKNSFRESVDGYTETSRLLYLNNEETQKQLQNTIIKKALDYDDFINGLPNKETIEKKVKAYYDLHAPTSRDIWRNVVNSLIDLGVDKSVAELVFPTVESLYVGNPTSQNDQWVQDNLAKILESFRYKVPSEQFKVLSDAICWGITNRVLGSRDSAALVTESLNIEQDYITSQSLKGISEKTITDNIERVTNIIDAIEENNPEVKDYLKRNIKELDKDTKVYLLKQLLLHRQSGFDLYAILNMSSKNKSLLDISKNIKTSLDTTVDNWVQSSINKKNKVSYSNIVRTSNHAVYDAEWFYSDNEKSTVKDVYQLGFVIRKAVTDEQKSKAIDSDTINDLQKFNILIKPNLLYKQDRMHYVESKEQFDDKIFFAKTGKSGEVINGVKTYIVDGATPEEAIKNAYKLFAEILQKNGVSVIMSYNGKIKNTEDISDSNLIRYYLGDDFFKNIDELDIRNDLAHKIWSRTSEDMNSDSMDAYRKAGKIKLNQNIKSHDAVSDCIDEYELYLRLINDKVEVDTLYSKPMSDIADLFGEDINPDNWSQDFEELLQETKFNKLEDITDNLKNIINKIDIDTSAFKRSNEAIKQVLDSYNLTFEHVYRRMELKDLKRVRENFLDIYDSTYNSKYFSSIKNRKNRLAVRNLLLGIINEAFNLEKAFSTVLEKQNKITGKAYYDANDITDINGLRDRFTYLTRLLAEAANLYKYDTRNVWTDKKISNKNNAKSFYSEDVRTIARYIAEAKETLDVFDTDRRNLIRRNFRTRVEKETDNLLNNSLNSEISDSLFKKDFYNMLRDERANLLSLTEYKETETQQNLFNHIANPLAKILGIIKSENGSEIVDTTIEKTFSPKLKNALFNDLINVYGATKTGIDTHDKVIERNTRNGVRYTLVNKGNSFLEGMLEQFTSENGLFNRGLRQKTALWSMGHERYKKTTSGEYGTIYIGEKLLNSKKSFKDMYGLYSAEQGKDEFYTITWRQPLQHEAPLQIVKVKVVKGDTFSMTTTTADNFFNGDFDGDQYFFSHPIALTESKDIKKLFELQNKQTELFYNLFSKDKTPLSKQIILEEKYRDLAREIYSKDAVKEAFRTVLDNIPVETDSQGNPIRVKSIPQYIGDETLINNFRIAYSRAFDEVASAKKYASLSKDDLDTLKKSFLNNFGIKLISTSKGISILSDNPFYRSDRNITMKLQALRNLYMLDNQANSGMDAPENGQTAKNYKWQKNSVDMDEAYRMFYNATFALKEDDLNLFSNLMVKNKLKITAINNYLDSLKGLISDDMIAWAKTYVEQEIINPYKSISSDASKKDIADNYYILVKRLSNLSNALQQNIITSKIYNDTLNSVLKDSLKFNNKEDYKKYKALHDFMYSQGYTNTPLKEYNEQETNGIQLLLDDTELFTRLFDEEQRRGYANIVSNDSGTLQDLYLNFIFRGDENNAAFDYKDNLEIMTRETLTNLNSKKGSKVIGLGSAVVAIDITKDGSLNDTIALFNKGNDSLTYTRAAELNLHSLTNKQREALINLLKQSKQTIKGMDINSALNLNFKEKTYQISGLVDGSGENLLNSLSTLTPENLNHAKLILIDKTPLYEMLETNEIKLGLLGSKALKGTVMNGIDLESRGQPLSLKQFKEQGEAKIRPDLAISSSLFEDAKLSYNLDYEDLGISADGKYRLVRLKDLTLLNALNLDAQDSAKDRYIDTIGIVQGAHGTGSVLSYGNMFLKEENNQWVFDPTGYNQLKDTLHYHTLENSFMDRNGSHTIRLLRIAYLLEVLPKDKQELICIELTKGKNITPTLQNTLESLYTAGDLGGTYGEDIEAYIWDKFSKEDKQKLELKLHQKTNNSLGKVAFSEEVNNQLVNRYATYFDYDPDNTIIKKHARPSKNIRVSNIRNYSDNADYLARLEGSIHDSNTSYVSRESILRMLLEENGTSLNKTTLKRAYDYGILNPVEGYLGTLYNGYKFIDSNQALQLDPYSEEKQSSKKAGNKEPYSQYNEVRENLRLIPILSDSLLTDRNKDNLENASATPDILDNKYRDAAAYNQLRFLLPFFSEGTDAQIWDSNNLFSARFVDSLNRKYLTSDEEGSLRIGTATVKPETEFEDSKYLTDNKMLTMEEEEQRIINNSISPKEVELLLKLKEPLDKLHLEALGITDAMDVSSFLSKQDEEDIKFLSNLCEKYKDTIDETYANYNNKPAMDDPFSLLRAIRKDSNDVLHVAEFYSDDNGIKLVNSWLRSWGFKSTDNRDISLGNQTINTRHRFASFKDELLGDDYELLMYNAKRNKASYMLLNQYMNAEEVVEAYDELTYRKDKWIKTLGKTKYSEYLEEVNKVIAQSGGDIEVIRQKQKDILNSHPTLSILITAAARINRRLMLETRAQDPFAFLGWFTDLTYGTDSHLVGYKNMQLKTFVKNDFIKSLNFDLEKMPETKLASIFHTKEYGYVPMVEKIASQLAVTKTVDNLASYMKDAGYMQNVDTFDIAMNTLQNSLDKFFENYNSEEADEDRERNNKATYDTLIHQCSLAGIDLYNIGMYTDESSIYTLFKFLYNKNISIKESLNVAKLGSADYTQFLYKAYINASDSQKDEYEIASKTNQMVINMTAVLVKMMNELDSSKSLLKDINNALLTSIPSDKVLVNRFGQKVNKGDLVNDYSSWHFFEDFLHLSLKDINNPDYLPDYIAQEALQGNIYLMDETVATQLEKKVFTQRIHSKVNKAIKKAKAIATTMIMTSPIQLLDRMINFPMFDVGINAGADVETFRYMPAAISTVTKFIQSGDRLTDEQIATDTEMKLLVRFLAAQGNLDIANNTVRGEKISLTKIPGLRQYLSLANKMYTAGNLIPRFAYFMNLVSSADENYKINRNKTGVAYHMYDSITGVEGDKATGIRGLNNAKSSSYYKEFGEDAQKVADMDAQAVQIIAEHNGIEGNMPYAARWLNENYNTMFLTFPMALLRWGKNRLQSLGYAFMESDSSSTNYLLRQAGSLLVTQTILLAIQLLLSQNSQDYLKKKLTGKEDEITEEEKQNAENILFRGGCIKLFESAMKGEEVTTTAQNRGAEASLFDSYVADFIPYFKSDKDESFMTTLKNKLLEHTWGHTPFIVKDTIESIPGNKYIQSTSWYEPSDNFFDNYGRKILGYNLGSTQANAFMDYLQAHGANNDLNDNAPGRLRNAMSYAFSKKYSNLKNNKSEIRNYKKAFKIVYDYFDAVYGKESDNTTTSSNSSSLTSTLRKAVETSNSSADVYFTIQKALSSGSTYIDIQKALKAISLRERLLTMDYKAFEQSLDSSELAIIKTALLYEEENYPYLEDVLTDVNNEANKEYIAANQSSYSIRNIASILKTMSYNTPKYRDYNSNNYKYSKQAKFFKNYNNSYKKQQQSPTDAYNNMINSANYGTSKDIWGNETQYYQDGTAYAKRNRGFNPLIGGNK